MEQLLDALEPTQTIYLPIPGGVIGDDYRLHWYFPDTPETVTIATAECDADGYGSWDWNRSYTESIYAYITTTTNTALTSEFSIDFIRPYADPASVAQTLSVSVQIARQFEKVSRLIINGQVGEFNYAPGLYTVTGTGADTLWLPDRIESLESVYVNGELLHDADNLVIKINTGKNSLVPISRDNRLEYPTVWSTRYQTPNFISGYDYDVTGVWGFRFVPADITEACELLIQDLHGGNLNYAQKGLSSFSNTEFALTFAKGFNEGTGNKIVDNLLLRYKNRIVPGVL